MTFKDFVIKEAVFKKSNKVIPITWGNLPMFTLYASSSLPPETIEELEYSEELMRYTFEEARKRIHALGFPSMHANVVFKDLRKEKNSNTGGRVGGYAYGSPDRSKGNKTSKYMEVDADSMLNSTTNYPVDLVVHEWAHLWMFKHNKEFKNAIKEYYQTELTSALDTLSKPFVFRKPSEDERINRNFNDKEKVWDFNIDDTITTHLVRGLFRLITGLYHDKFSVEYGNEDDYFVAQSQQRLKNLNESFQADIKDVILGAIKISNDYMKSKWEFDREVSVKEYKLPIEDLAKYCADFFLPLAESYVDKLLTLEKEDAFYSNVSQPGLFDSRYTKHLGKGNYDDQFNTVVDIDDDMVVPETISWAIMEMIRHSIQKEQIEMLKVRKQTSGKTYNDIRKKIATISKWVSAYGMSDDDEMWATAVEKFFDLPREHRSKILKLMLT